VTDFTSIPTVLPRRLLGSLRRRPDAEALTATFSESAGLGALLPALNPFLDRPADMVVPVLEAVLAERDQPDAESVKVVWTGPEPQSGTARDTAVVLQALFGEAREMVFIGGYRFTQGERILSGLHRAMRERGVSARICFGVPGSSGASREADFAARAARTLLDENWPFGEPYPELFYDPLTTRSSTTLVHAKCAIVDEKTSLVTSANFTHHGQEKNIEVGALIRSPRFARSLLAQWLGLIEGGFLARVDARR